MSDPQQSRRSIAAKRGSLLRKAAQATEMSLQYAREAERLEREAGKLVVGGNMAELKS